jgi:hypothetical protein
MVTIEILNTHFVTDPDTGQPIARHTNVIVTQNGNSYLWGVGGLPLTGNLQTILEAREAELLAAAIAAGVVANVAEIAERRDFAGLEADITGELAWITGAIAEIDTGLGVVDAATLAQLRVIVKGLLQNQRRILLEQQRELKAWRLVIRRLG